MTANTSKRAAFLVLVTVAALVAVLRWSGGPDAPGGSTGFATPAACRDAYRDAVQEADAAAYLRCLGEPLRAETRRFNEQVVYQSWDMLAGRLMPELGGSRRHLDIIGVNYYWTNQWEHGRPGIPRAA